MVKNKYSFWRLIAVCSVLFVCLVFFLCYFIIPADLRIVFLSVLIPVSVFLIISFIHQMRFPLDLRVYVIWVCIFSWLAVSYGFSALSLFIMYCAYFLSLRIHFLSKGKNWKIIFAVTGYVISSLYQLRLPLMELVNSIAEFLMMLVGMLLMHFILKHLMTRINKEVFLELEKENLDSYFESMNFTERDRVILNEVLDGHKYEEIAINHNLSVSSIKKRLAFLYKKLGVTCQIDFIIKFSRKN